MPIIIKREKNRANYFARKTKRAEVQDPYRKISIFLTVRYLKQIETFLNHSHDNIEKSVLSLTRKGKTNLCNLGFSLSAPLLFLSLQGLK